MLSLWWVAMQLNPRLTTGLAMLCLAILLWRERNIDLDTAIKTTMFIVSNVLNLFSWSPGNPPSREPSNVPKP